MAEKANNEGAGVTGVGVVIHAIGRELNLLSHEFIAAEEKAADAVGLGDLQRQVDEEYAFTVKPSRVLCIVLSLILLRGIWNSWPEWAKPVWLRKKRIYEKERKDANDDLASPHMIFRKLRQMMTIASNKCAVVTPDDMRWYQVYGAFFAMLHLFKEIRANKPAFRGEQYHDFEASRDSTKHIHGSIAGRDATPDLDDELTHLQSLMDMADWAYLEDYDDLRILLKKRDMDLIRQDLATEPGRVGHFLAVSYTQKLLVIGIKGTSSMADVLTDLVGHTVPCNLETSPFDASHTTTDVRCHEGILTATLMLADELQGLLENVFLPAKLNVLICGHSLGAGTATLLGLILRSRIPALQGKAIPVEKVAIGTRFVRKPFFKPTDPRLRVVAFATPPVLNYTAAIACAPFCTSIINNADIVPRCSVSNLVIMNQLMVAVNRKLLGRDKNGSFRSRFRAAWINFKDLFRVDDYLLMSTDEWDTFFDETHRERSATEELNLYVPGKCICLYEEQQVGDEQELAVAAAANAQDNRPRWKFWGGRGRKKEEKPKVYAAVVGDGGQKMLRQIELMGSMVSDHACDSYRTTIAGFVSSAEQSF